MSFYGEGDWYGAGDPGFSLSTIFGGVKKAVGFIPGVGTAAKVGLTVAGGLTEHLYKSTKARQAGGERGLLSTERHPGLPSWMHRGETGTPVTRGKMRKERPLPGRAGRRAYELGMGPRPRHRRMNVVNLKALRRAVRRLLGFRHVAGQVVASLSAVAPVARRGTRRRAAVCPACGFARCRCPKRLMRPRGDFYGEE